MSLRFDMKSERVPNQVSGETGPSHIQFLYSMCVPYLTLEDRIQPCPWTPIILESMHVPRSQSLCVPCMKSMCVLWVRLYGVDVCPL